jgi:hypothetical protein
MSVCLRQDFLKIKQNISICLTGRSFEASKANGHEECSGNRVVIKARQVGSEIHSLDLHSNYDPHNPQSSFYKVRLLFAVHFYLGIVHE